MGPRCRLPDAAGGAGQRLPCWDQLLTLWAGNGWGVGEGASQQGKTEHVEPFLNLCGHSGGGGRRRTAPPRSHRACPRPHVMASSSVWPVTPHHRSLEHVQSHRSQSVSPSCLPPVGVCCKSYPVSQCGQIRECLVGACPVAACRHRGQRLQSRQKPRRIDTCLARGPC